LILDLEMLINILTTA